MSDYFEEFEIKIIGDSRGKMVVIEGYKNIPFDIKRLFYVFGADEKSIRGCHANKKSEFVIICVSGKAKIMISVPPISGSTFFLNFSVSDCSFSREICPTF